MAGGPMFPSSIYLGGASGNLSSTIFVPSTNTNAAGAIEGIGVIGSLGSDSTAVLQFNLPETIPTGTCKLRTLMWAPDAHAGKLTISDGQTAVSSNIGATTLTAETQISITAVVDVINENKTTLTTAPTSNNILTIKAVFNTTGWAITGTSVWQFSLVWE
jgi:hypothetical protein